MAGWSLLVLYAAAFETGEMTITRDYVEYITGNTILLGAEFDKLLSIGIVTAVLAAAVLRARQTLFIAVSEGSAKRDLSRFFDTFVADQITGSEHELRAGEGQHRNAAAVFFDIRGFTGLSDRLDAGELVQLLSEYQSQIVTLETYDLALAQGFEPRHPGDRRIGRAVEGVGGFVDLVALGRRRDVWLYRRAF